MTWRRLLLVTLALLVTACGADFWYIETNNLSGGPTIVIIRWSDSPVDDAESVIVTLDRIELLNSGDESEVLLDRRQPHDLLRLRNGQVADLVRATVPAGEWSGLRFVLAPEEAGLHTIRVGGSTHRLDFLDPLGNVIDVPYSMDLPEDAETVVHVDFNVRMSIVEAGAAWLLDPRLRATDPAGAGAIDGVVRTAAGAPVAGATVSAQRENEEILSTRTFVGGTFRLATLDPGRYDLVATALGYAPASLPQVTVFAGEDSGGQVLVLGAAASGGLDGFGPAGQPGLRVRVIGAAGFVAMAGVDPATGEFRLPQIAAGTYWVELWDGERRIDAQAGVLIAPGATTTVAF